jgi:chromosome segregation ATPase
MSEDELSALQEQLAEAQAENERLQATAADREARALHLDELNGQLREQLAAVQAEMSSVQADLSAAQVALSAVQTEKDDLHARLQAAVGKYREALLTAAPEVFEDMVTGESIEEVDAAMERARQTVLQVRERLESQAQAGRVPMGSPPRTAPDLSALSPIEKIRLGLGQK